MKLFSKKKQETEVAVEGTESESFQPKKKKGFVKFIVLGVVVLAIGGYIFTQIKAKNAPMPVTTQAVGKGDIEVIVSISGNVASDETKSYYAKVSAPIEKLSLSKGDRVSKGDLLFSYDESELDKTMKQAELSLQQANGSYSGSIEKNNKATDVLKGNSIHTINARIDEINDQIVALNDKITEKTTRMNKTLSDLQKVSQDVDENSMLDSYDATHKNDAPEERRTDDGDTQMALEISNAISDVQFALSNDPEIEAWKKQISDLQSESQDLSEQASAEMSALTSGEKSALLAQKELTELEYANTVEDIEAVKGGIKADFAGVVTELGTEEGATVAPGTKVITIESTDDVRVDIQISKSDLSKVQVGQSVDITINGNEYEGEVVHISGSAVNNASGVPVVDAKIKINNPDDKIILGVEAGNKIHTDKAEGVVVVPYEFIGTDSDGDYVFVIENGLLVRRPITIGLSTSTDAEVSEGLKDGDVIVTTDPATLTEGTKVIEANF